MKNKNFTTVAIAYDFDGTLARGNIQENSFLPDLGIKKEDFWHEVTALAKKDEMDGILAYMYLLLAKAKISETVKIDKESLKAHGKTVNYFKGVEDYFERINKFAKERGIILEHYIVSSGTKEMIEGTSIAKNFKYIYASSFKYDQHGVAIWPAIAINYTTKTQYLFRINKGINNAWDDSKINVHVPYDERPVPFKNMVYIGDGLTDVPAMKMLKFQGGTSIAVYDEKKRGAKEISKELILQDRVCYVAKADYRDGGELDTILKSVISQISEREKIKKFK